MQMHETIAKLLSTVSAQHLFMIYSNASNSTTSKCIKITALNYMYMYVYTSTCRTRMLQKNGTFATPACDRNGRRSVGGDISSCRTPQSMASYHTRSNKMVLSIENS